MSPHYCWSQQDAPHRDPWLHLPAHQAAVLRVSIWQAHGRTDDQNDGKEGYTVSGDVSTFTVMGDGSSEKKILPVLNLKSGNSEIHSMTCIAFWCV